MPSVSLCFSLATIGRFTCCAIEEVQEIAPAEPSTHIVIVDDDKDIRELLATFLDRHGYRVSSAADGDRMWRILKENKADLVVLDVLLPGRSGLELCREIRATSSLPVILLTAIAEESDRIVGLEIGADDYIAKPFSPRELLARIRSVLRRAGTNEPVATTTRKSVAHFAGWTLDLARRRILSPDGVLVALTSGEFDLLAVFVEYQGQVLSRDRLLDLTGGSRAASFDRSIDVQISRLRRKIEADPGKPSQILTVRGDGYVFAPEVSFQ